MNHGSILVIFSLQKTVVHLCGPCRLSKEDNIFVGVFVFTDKRGLFVIRLEQVLFTVHLLSYGWNVAVRELERKVEGINSLEAAKFD